MRRGIGRTMAVGMYPEGRSLQDVYDLVGNIWEWCRNSYNDLRGRTTEADMPSVYGVASGATIWPSRALTTATSTIRPFAEPPTVFAWFARPPSFADH